MVSLRGLTKAAVTYGVAELLLQRGRVGLRLKKIGWGALTAYLGGKLVLWGLVALVALLVFQLAGWEFLVKPAGVFAGVSIALGLLLIWQGVTVIKH